MFTSGRVPSARLSRRKPVAALLAALCVALVATSAHAEPFSYYTTGTFLTSSSDTLVLGGSTLKFNGEGTVGTPITGNSTNTNIHLGKFFLTDNDPSVGNFDLYTGQNFRLNIFQTAPAVGGSGILIGTFTGSFLNVPPDSSVDLEITLGGFVVAPSAIPGQVIVYTPKPNPETVEITANDPTGNTVEGLARTVGAESVPLPTAGWAGLALFGLVGLVRFGSARRVA